MSKQNNCDDLLKNFETTLSNMASNILAKSDLVEIRKLKKKYILELQKNLKTLYEYSEQQCLEYVLSKFYAGKPRPFKDAYSYFMNMMQENDLHDTTSFIAKELINSELMKRNSGEFKSWFGANKKQGRTPESGFFTGPGQTNLIKNAKLLPDSLKDRVFPRCEEILNMIRRIMNNPKLDFCATKQQFHERFSYFRYRQETIQLENIIVELFRDRVCLDMLLNNNQTFRQAFRQYHRGLRINGIRDMLWELYHTPGFGPSGPSAWETAFDDL